MSNLEQLRIYLENKISRIKEEESKLASTKEYKSIADKIIDLFVIIL